MNNSSGNRIPFIVPICWPYFSRQTFTPSAITSHVGSAGDLLHRTTAKTMAVLTTTSMTTKAVLSAVGDHRWWKESLNYLRPLQVRPLTACVVVLNWPAMEQMMRFPAQSLLNKPASLANSTPVVAMCGVPTNYRIPVSQLQLSLSLHSNHH